MVNIYGYVKATCFAIGDDLREIFIGTYTRTEASKILMDKNYIKRWNDNHIATLVKISIEIAED